jgi:ferrous iron transport protein B
VAQVIATQQEVRRILAVAVNEPADSLHTDDAIDRVVLHPLWGMLLLALTLFLMFQAVFSLATVPMEWIKAGVDALGNLIRSGLPPGVLQSLLVDGILAGTGGVLVFLPQILILFLLHHCPGGFGLSAARGVPAGPGHGDGWSVGALVHSACCPASPVPFPV